MKYRWLLLAIVAFVAGLMASRALKLSEPAAMTLTVVPAFLVSFPFMKHWMPKARFLYWVTAAVISTAVGWLLNFVLTRLGG